MRAVFLQNWVTCRRAGGGRSVEKLRFNEIKELELQNTWSITNLPLNRNVLRGKWVYKIKTDSCVESLQHEQVSTLASRVTGIDIRCMYNIDISILCIIGYC
jgi:hypothetical protein